MTSSDTLVRMTGEPGKAMTKELFRPPREISLDARSLSAPPLAASEEDLIVDDRSAMSPSQAVENRLSHLLSGTTVPVSHLLVRGRLLKR